MKKVIAVLSGDGVGQEVMPFAIQVLDRIAERYDHHFEKHFADVGGEGYENQGSHFPESTRMLCERADAILFGSVGGPVHEAHLPKWKDCERNSILALRQTFQLSANLRPVKIHPSLAEISPLKKSRIAGEVDILLIRELVGDVYFGAHTREMRNDVQLAKDVAQYDEHQIQVAAELAFRFALQRGRKLTSVDKANVLETSRLWREVVQKVALKYPEVHCEHMLVDNCAMQLILNPGQFDVILTSNLFGDILSDEAAAIPGSLGLIPSASLNATNFGLYEPCGGSAPDIAGKNKANPIAQILSAALMLRYSFALEEEATVIERAVEKALEQGYRTQDIHSDGKILVGSAEMVDQIIQNL